MGVRTPCYPHPRGCKLHVIRTSGGANSVLSAPTGVRTMCYHYQKGVQLRPTNVYFKKPFVFCRMLCFVKNQNRYPDILVLHRLANKQLCLNVGIVCSSPQTDKPKVALISNYIHKFYFKLVNVLKILNWKSISFCEVTFH